MLGFDITKRIFGRSYQCRSAYKLNSHIDQENLTNNRCSAEQWQLMDWSFMTFSNLFLCCIHALTLLHKPEHKARYEGDNLHKGETHSAYRLRQTACQCCDHTLIIMFIHRIRSIDGPRPEMKHLVVALSSYILRHTLVIHMHAQLKSQQRPFHTLATLLESLWAPAFASSRYPAVDFLFSLKYSL